MGKETALYCPSLKLETEMQEEDTLPQILQNLIVVIGLGFLACYVMWPDVREQVEKTKNSGIEAYTVDITCYFALLFLFLAIVSILMWLWERGGGDWHKDEYQFVDVEIDEEIGIVMVVSNDKRH